MRGDQQVLDFLNKALRHELAAINQYWLRYRILDNRGYKASGRPRGSKPEKEICSALAIVLLAFIVSPACADPFDDWCRTARLPSSIAICSDAELRTLAIERNGAFVEAEARLSPEQQKALLADQNDWVRSYTRVCGLSEMPPALTLAPEVKACMARAGSARIAYLRAYGSYSAPPPLGQTSAPFAQTPAASATVASSPTRIGPSFDCSKASSPLALMICASPALSKVDLRFVQAYRALWQQVGQDGQSQLLREAVDFQNAVLRACRIPETGPVSGSPQCVAAEYERQRSIWLSRLNGPASEEASRPIEQHIALQATLQKLGFLPAAVMIDGVYGDATRSSILAWQSVNRRPQTGFLDDADATALAGTGETEATPATQSPSPGQGVPGAGSPLEAAAGAQLPIQPATVAPAAPPPGQLAPTPGSLRPQAGAQTGLAAATPAPDVPPRPVKPRDVWYPSALLQVVHDNVALAKDDAVIRWWAAYRFEKEFRLFTGQEFKLQPVLERARKDLLESLVQANTREVTILVSAQIGTYDFKAQRFPISLDLSQGAGNALDQKSNSFHMDAISCCAVPPPAATGITLKVDDLDSIFALPMDSGSAQDFVEKRTGIGGSVNRSVVIVLTVKLDGVGFKSRFNSGAAGTGVLESAAFFPDQQLARPLYVLAEPDLDRMRAAKAAAKAAQMAAQAKAEEERQAAKAAQMAAQAKAEEERQAAKAAQMAASGNSLSAKSPSGKYFIQNLGGSPSSLDFHSNGTVDVQGILGLENTTYNFDGSQVSFSSPLVPGTEPVLYTLKMDSAGCLGEDLPVVGTVKWCSKPFVLR